MNTRLHFNAHQAARDVLPVSVGSGAREPVLRSDLAIRQPRRDVAVQLRERYEWGDITSEEYHEKREWLLSQRAEVSAPDPQPSLRLSGLLDAWERADGLGRRELIAALFVELDVRDGRLWRVNPQPDVAAELWTHLREWALGLNSETGVLEVAPAGFEATPTKPRSHFGERFEVEGGQAIGWCLRWRCLSSN